jgi:hypothetical protein
MDEKLPWILALEDLRTGLDTINEIHELHCTTSLETAIGCKI